MARRDVGHEQDAPGRRLGERPGDGLADGRVGVGVVAQRLARRRAQDREDGVLGDPVEGVLAGRERPGRPDARHAHKRVDGVDVPVVAEHGGAAADRDGERAEQGADGVGRVRPERGVRADVRVVRRARSRAGLGDRRDRGRPGGRGSRVRGRRARGRVAARRGVGARHRVGAGARRRRRADLGETQRDEVVARREGRGRRPSGVPATPHERANGGDRSEQEDPEEGRHAGREVGLRIRKGSPPPRAPPPPRRGSGAAPR